MKKFICLLLATQIMCGTVAHAQIDCLYINEKTAVTIEFQLPEKCEGDYYSVYVLNPKKTKDNLISGINETDVQYYAQGEYKKGGASVSFNINSDLLENSGESMLPVIVKSGDYEEESMFYAYPDSVRQELLNEINQKKQDKIDTLCNRIVEMFNIGNFEIYNKVSDKISLANKLFTVLGKTEATDENIVSYMKQATVLEGIKNGEVKLFENGEFADGGVIGIDENVKKLTEVIRNVNDIAAKAENHDWSSIEDLKNAISDNLIVAAIYNNQAMGYGHIEEILLSNIDFLQRKGFDADSYKASQKDKVGQVLIADGEKSFEEMIKAINSYSAAYKLNSESKPKDTSSSSSGYKESTTGIVAGNTTNSNSEQTNEFEFTDLGQAEWAREKINALLKKGVVAKSEDGKFYPSHPITRAEFTKLAVEALNITGDAQNSFADVGADGWFSPYINRGVAAGIIFGDGENFRPNENIKRQDIAVILNRALDYKGIKPENTGEKMIFSDKSTISDYAENAVELLYQYGIINGNENNEFLPFNSAARSEAAVMIYGVLNAAESGFKARSNVADASPVQGNEPGEKTSNAAELMARAGIISAELVSDLNENVTRADFAEIIARYAAKSENYSYSGKSGFQDVNEDTPNAGYIEHMTEQGYFEKSSFYHPNDYISGVDAVKAVMNVLGYGAILKSDNDYLNRASALGITKSVSISQNPISKGNIIKLFENSLTANVVTIAVENGDISLKEGETFLENYHNIILLKGIMNGNFITSYNTGIKPKKNMILIDSMEFEVDNDLYYINDYLGYYLELAYDKDTERVVGFRTLNNEEIVVSDRDFIEYSNGKIYYEEDTKQKSITIPKDAVVVYNGVVSEQYDENIFDIETGSIEFLAAKGGRYNIVKVYDYESFAVNGVTSEKLYSRNNEIISLEEYDNVVVRDREGGIINISDISAGDVVSVAESKDKKQIIIIDSKTKKIGKISNINKSEKQVSVDGAKLYYLEKSGIELAKVSYSGMFYLDFKGNVAYADFSGKDGWRYAYLIRAVYDSAEGKAVIRIFNDDGDFENIMQEEDIVIDGTKTAPDKIDKSFLHNTAGELKEKNQRQLIKYRQKSDGTISDIDTAYKAPEEDDKSLSVNRDVYNDKRIYNPGTNRLAESRNDPTGYVENSMLLDENTKVFMVPNEDETDFDEDDYSITSLAWFEGRSKSVNGPVWAFDMDYANGGKVGALAFPSDQGGSEISARTMFYITDISESLNDDNEITAEITGFDYNSASEKTLYSYNKKNIFEGLKAGDFIRYHIDGNGKVDLINLELDWETATVGYRTCPFTTDNDGSWTGDALVACHYSILTNKDGNYVSFSDSIEYEDGKIKRGNMIFDCSNANIMRFNTRTGKTDNISPDELNDYLYEKNKTARIFIYVSSTALKSAVVYEF